MFYRNVIYLRYDVVSLRGWSVHQVLQAVDI